MLIYTAFWSTICTDIVVWYWSIAAFWSTVCTVIDFGRRLSCQRLALDSGMSGRGRAQGRGRGAGVSAGHAVIDEHTVVIGAGAAAVEAAAPAVMAAAPAAVVDTPAVAAAAPVVVAAVAADGVHAGGGHQVVLNQGVGAAAPAATTTALAARAPIATPGMFREMVRISQNRIRIFDGRNSREVDGFLLDVDGLASSMGWDNQNRVALVHANCTGTAATWVSAWLQKSDNGNPHIWQVFRADFFKRFAHRSELSEVLGKLAHSRDFNDVASFSDVFAEQVSRLEQLGALNSEEMKLTMYLDRLPPDVARAVQMQNPATFARAMECATNYAAWVVPMATAPPFGRGPRQRADQDVDGPRPKFAALERPDERYNSPSNHNFNGRSNGRRQGHNQPSGYNPQQAGPTHPHPAPRPTQTPTPSVPRGPPPSTAGGTTRACFVCGSTEHLKRECPQWVNQGNGRRL